MRHAAALILLAAAAVPLGCGGSSDGGGEPSAEDTARSYVEAINARDGSRVCALLVESAAYELRLPGQYECPKYVSAFIGYGEEADTSTFHQARIAAVEEGERRGELRSLRLELDVELNRRGNENDRFTQSFDDVMWLVEQEGRWRLAKASGLLYAAFAAYNWPEDWRAAPNLAAQNAEFERKVAEEKSHAQAASRSFTDFEGDVFDCSGGETSYDDGAGDLHLEGGRPLTRAEARRHPAADIRRVEVDTEGDDLCVRVTLGGNRVGKRLLFRFGIYSPEKNPTYLGPQTQVLLEVRPDGRGRLVYEDESREDEHGRHPLVPIGARLGRTGNTFGFRVARADLPRQRPTSEGVPSWDGFLWGGLTLDEVEIGGERRAISDDVHAYNAMISHPGGKVFDPFERTLRDLPTD